MPFAEAFTTTLVAGGALILAYEFVMWLADRAIDGIGHMTRWEK